MNKNKNVINFIMFLMLFVASMDLSLASPTKHHYKHSTYNKKKHYAQNNVKIEAQIIENNNISNEKKDNDLLMNAFSFLGIAYKYGSSSPMYGLDCSGFIKYIFKETLNLDLPRTVSAMYNVGVNVKKEELKFGDLIFFNTIGKRISHIGMYIGHNEFIHSPRSGKNIEIQSLNNSYWSKRYITAKRVILDN